MSAVQMRPTFVLTSALDAAATMGRIRAVFGAGEQAGEGGRYQAQYTGLHAMIAIHEADRHFWSPWLSVDVREDEDGAGGVVVAGRFSPHPSVWTAFMFIYLALAIVLFFATVLGLSQQLSGQSAWAYSVVPVCIAAAVGLWLFSRAGQKLAQDEMRRLQETLAAGIAAA